MIRWVATAAIAAAVLVGPGAGAAEARRFTAEDLASLSRVADPRVSPDGRWTLYDLRTADLGANSAAHELWIVDLAQATPAPRRLKISDGGVASARWSANGKRIYFISGRSGSNQVWRTDVAGESAQQVTSLPYDVGAFAVTRDEQKVVVDQPTYPDCPTLECSQTRLADKGLSKTRGKSTGMAYDRLFVRHWDSWADGRRNHLFVLDLDAQGVAAGAPRDLTPGLDGDVPSKPFGDDADFTLSPDGRSVVYAARVAGRIEPLSTNFDLYRTPLDGGAAENLTVGNPAWDAGPVFSPNGELMAYRAMSRPGFEADRWSVMVRDMATGKTE